MFRFLLLAVFLAISSGLVIPAVAPRTRAIQMNDTPGVKANFEGGSFQDYLDAQKKKKEEEEKAKKE